MGILKGRNGREAMKMNALKEESYATMRAVLRLTHGRPLQ